MYTYQIGGIYVSTLSLANGVHALAGNIINNGLEFQFNWDKVEGAESYQLEWTWVDAYDNFDDDDDIATGYRSASDIDFSTRNFELNNTRGCN